MSKIALFFGICSVAFPAVPLAQVAKIAHPENARNAALAYLEGELAKAGINPDYLQEAWKIDFEVFKDQLELGPPYQVGRVLSDDLAVFAETGAINPRYGWFVYFPVLHAGRCLKLIIVKEDDGVWASVGRKDWGAETDSLAVAQASEGVSVAVVTIKQLGGLIVMEPKEGPTLVIPLGEAVDYVRPLIESGVVAFDSAIEALRPRARQLARDFERYQEEEQ